jgi:acetyltransferase
MAASNIVLRDGRSVQLREMEVGDLAELLQAFWRMSEHARYMRMMRVVREPNLERVGALIASFPEAGVGLVATVPASDGLDIVGSAIAIFTPDRTSCEFAISVDAAFGQARLATTLMTALMEEARRRGIEEMHGFVLSQNQPMLRLARRLGFDIRSDPDDASVRICRIALDQPASVELHG